MCNAFSQIERKARRWKWRVRVYCEAWPNPRISSPPWVAELARLCGGEMIVPGGENVTEAQVASAGPESLCLRGRRQERRPTLSRRIKSRIGKMCPQFETA